MISIKLQIVLFLSSLLGFFYLLNKIKKHHLELRYALLWLGLSIVLILLSIFPIISIKFSELLDFEKPVNALFLLGMLGTGVILFSITTTISKFSTKIKELSQELGLLKNEMEKRKEKDN